MKGGCQMSLWLLFWYFVLAFLFSWLDYDYTTNSKLAVVVLFIIGNVVDAHSTAFMLYRDTNSYFKETSYIIRWAMEKWGAMGIVFVKFLTLPFCFLVFLNPDAGLALSILLFYCAISNYGLYFKHYGRP